MKTKNKKIQKHTLLKGEGENQHTLYGEFLISEDVDFARLTLTKGSVLKHETPSGAFAEHNALSLEEGKWVMGKQVEYNPFNREVSQVWD